MTTDLNTVRRHELLMQLLRLSRAQGEALQAERVDRFLSLMAEREQLFVELLSGEDHPLPSNVVLFPSIARFAEDPEVTLSTSVLISTILEQDEKNEVLLLAEMEKLRAALAHVGQGLAAAQGYGAALRYDDTGRRLDVAY